MSDPHRPHPLHRYALGLWFLGLGVLGLVRSLMRARRVADASVDTVAQLWLWGSVLLCVVGIIFIARALRHRPHARDD